MFVYPEYPEQLRSLSDQELLVRFHEKQEEAAFSALFERYAHLVYGACVQILKDANEAQSACLTVFLRLRQSSTQSIKQLDHYLFMLSRNESVSRLRKLQKTLKNEQWYLDWKKSGADRVEFPEVERLIYRADTQKRETAMRDAMAKLPPKQLNCLRLFYEDQLPYREIAKQLSIEEGMVKSHLQNGRRRLHKLVAAALRAKLL